MPYPSTFVSADAMLPKLNDWLNGIPAWLDNINAGSFNLSNLKHLTFRQNTAPAAPAAGDVTAYMDFDTRIKLKESSGTIFLDVAGTALTDAASRGQIVMRSSQAFSVPPTCGIALAVKYNAAGAFVFGVSIQNVKENATDGDFAQSMMFTTQANGASPVERMRLNSQGRLGIGTASPQDDLHLGRPESRIILTTNANGANCIEVVRSDLTNPAGIATSDFGKDWIFKPANSERFRVATTGVRVVGDLSMPLRMDKSTVGVAAPGAGVGQLRFEAGTGAGTLKLVAYAGTSTTGVTIIDNVGAGN